MSATKEYRANPFNPYEKPALARLGNLLNITAEWQCSVVDDRHSHHRGRGHGSHGNGHGNGHH